MEELRDWVLQARQGDLESYGKIVRRFQDMAYGYAYSLLSDFHLAEDAAQEAFIEAYRELADLRTPEAFPGWFRKIVFKQCDRIARRKRQRVLSHEAEGRLASREPEPSDIAAKKEMAESVLRAIQALPEPERTVTTLFYINGYSQNDIADFLEVPATTVNNRLHKSRERLRERIMNMVADEIRSHPLPDDFARQMVEKAKQLIREKKHGEAEDALRQALQAVPNHPEALRQLNRALMWGRVYGLAHWELMPQLAAHGEAILKSGQGGADFFKDFSETLLVIPDMPRAISSIQGWISQRGPSLEALGKLAWAKGCVGDYPGADSTWDELIGFGKDRPRGEIGAHVPHACMALVDCLACAGEVERARRVVRGGWDVLSPGRRFAARSARRAARPLAGAVQAGRTARGCRCSCADVPRRAPCPVAPGCHFRGRGHVCASLVRRSAESDIGMASVGS